MRKESWKERGERERERGKRGGEARRERAEIVRLFFFWRRTDFDWDGMFGCFNQNQESVKRYAAKGSKQRPFKLPEALATNDRGKDWDVVPPDPVPDP